MNALAVDSGGKQDIDRNLGNIRCFHISLGIVTNECCSEVTAKKKVGNEENW